MLSQVSSIHVLYKLHVTLLTHISIHNHSQSRLANVNILTRLLYSVHCDINMISEQALHERTQMEICAMHMR